MAPVIGLDVGGANTKAAVVDGDMRVRTVSEPFEVWREPEAMPGVIAEVVGRLGLDDVPVALTTTAELVDVFASKREGVLFVLEATRKALPGRPVRVMTTDGELVSLAEAGAAPLRCAAANWMATAVLVARSLPDAILVDCGGTTTDVIPIVATHRRRAGQDATSSGCSRASWSTQARCGPTSPRWSRMCRSPGGPAPCPPSYTP